MGKKTVPTITQDEGEKLICHRQTQRNKLIILLMLDAGLRVGEVVSLHRDDLWFNGQPRTSLIVRGITTKTKTDRTVPLTVRLQEAIRIFGNLSMWNRIIMGNLYAFPGRYKSTHLRIRSVQTMIELCSEAAIGRNIHPHQLRHTFATRLMQNTNIRVVQELLGHKHLTSTQIYTHPNHQDLTKAIDSLTD